MFMEEVRRTPITVKSNLLKVYDLRFEHYRPGRTLGVEHSRPRISWKISNAPKNFQQTAYEIEVYDLSRHTQPVLLCCKQLSSSQSQLVQWPSNQSLSSRQRISARVRIWLGNDGPSLWSEQAFLETGLLEATDWHCFRIAGHDDATTVGPRPENLFRKVFSVRSGMLRARLYITAQGVYESEINGQRVGNELLAPGWTNYDRRLHYQTYDVTDLIKLTGESCLAIRLAEGWFCGRLGFGGGSRGFWGEQPAVMAQLEIIYSDQSTQEVLTDESWLAACGPIKTAEIYDGERYDATCEVEGWSQPSTEANLDSSQWRNVHVLPNLPRSVELVADYKTPVLRKQIFQSVQTITTPSGKTILDFGQNLVGYVRIKAVQGERGHTVSLSHAEVLEKNELGRRPLREALAIDQYTLKGLGSPESWEPRFTFHGFRYCQVEGWPAGSPKIEESLEAVVCFSDMEPVGGFSCSNEMLNKLHENSVWSMRGNFLSIPTDCPQRDERLGWTGDIALFAPTATKLYDCYSVLGSWLVDVEYEQDLRNGIPALVTPNVFQGIKFWQDPWPCAIWHDVTILLPWALYEASGDVGVLARQYRSMKTWLERIPRDTNKNNQLWNPSYFQLGDWLDPSAPPENPANGKTNSVLVADAFLIQSLDLSSRIAGVLAEEADSKAFGAMAKSARQQFAGEYITSAGRITSESQTAYALAICFDLFPTRAQQEYAGELLATIVRKNGFKIGTGFAGTPYICEALVRGSHTPEAFSMLLNQFCPSWLYPVTMGATTTWERWDSMLPDGSINPGEMTSFNHYCYGAVVSFLHERVAGLQILEPGWKRSRAAPIVCGGITNAKVEYLTPYGQIGCSWSVEGDEFTISVLVPPMTTMEVVIPIEGGQKTEVVSAGSWVFSGPHNPIPGWPAKPIPSVPWLEE